MVNYADRLFYKWLEQVQQNEYVRKFIAGILIIGLLSAIVYFIYMLLPRSYVLTIWTGDITEGRHLLARALQKEAKSAGITLNIVSSAIGGDDVIDSLDNGKFDLALVNVVETDYVNVEHVATLMPEAVHFLVNSEITTIADIKGKRINVGVDDTIKNIMTTILALSGFQDTDYIITRYDEDTLERNVLEGKNKFLPDVIISVSFPPSYVATYFVMAGYHLLELPFAALIAQEKNKWATSAKIPAYSYSVQPPLPATDFSTIGVNLVLLANSRVDNEAIFKLLEVLYSRSVADQMDYLHLDEKNIIKAPGFPVSQATKTFLKRNNSLLTVKTLNALKNGFGLMISLLSAIVFLWRWLRGQRSSDDKSFKILLKEIAKIEASLRKIESEPNASIAEIAEINTQLSHLKEKILMDFPSGAFNDPSILDKLMHSIADTRAFQRAVQTRAEARKHLDATIPRLNEK